MSGYKRRDFDGQEQGSSPSGLKKPRIGGTAAPSFLPPQGDLQSIASPPTTLPARPSTTAAEAAIAAARAKIAAKFAAFKPGGAAAAALAPPAPAVATTSPSPGPSTSTPPPPPQAATPAPRAADSAVPPPTATTKSTADAIAEARARIEAMKARAAKAANPYLAQNDKTTPGAGPSPGIHPLLAQNDTTFQARSSKDRYKPMAPKFATLKANVRQNVPAYNIKKTGTPGPSDDSGYKPENNPYYDPSISSEFAPKERRTHKQLKFNQKGKFTRLAEQMRQEQKLEALKARIAEASKKAGLAEEIESGALIRRQPPPDVEWWDTSYLPNKTYEDIPDQAEVAKLPDPQEAILSKLDLTTVNNLIQHPIPIPAPGDKHQQAPKSLFLTKKEMKKLRRNRRAAEHKDMQDRIRMGLAPPPPDKIKISNMYRVLTQEAVADPTKIEARVRREMMARERAHLKANEERKLTDEQRKEKIEKQKEKDEAKGIYAAVFKVRYLSDGGHRFKVRKNAEQNGLSGVLVFNKNFNLVYVEGGQKGVRAYTKLMQNRIKWTEASAARNAPTTGTPGPEGDEGNDAAQGHFQQGNDPSADGEAEEPHNLADNYCYLVWEGQQKERSFREFRPKACPSDAIAKEFLGSQQGLWDVAKRYEPEE